MSTTKSLVPINPSAQINGQPKVAELYPFLSAVCNISISEDLDPQGL